MRIHVFPEAVRPFLLTLVSQRLHKEAMMISKRPFYAFLGSFLIWTRAGCAALESAGVAWSARGAHGMSREQSIGGLLEFLYASSRRSSKASLQRDGGPGCGQVSTFHLRRWRRQVFRAPRPN